MRISDWSSDVCSSDLLPGKRFAVEIEPGIIRPAGWGKAWRTWLSEEPCAKYERIAFPVGNPSQFSWSPSVNCKQNRKRSEEHTSELQSLMRISYAVFCLKKKK